MEKELFFSAQGLGALQTLLLAALLTFVIARKNEKKELRKELESLRTELKADSKELRAEKCPAISDYRYTGENRR
jgi:hypothetical protein